MSDEPDYGAINRRAYGPLSIGGPPVHQRVQRQVLNQTYGVSLTPRQIAAVLHALADHTLNQHMVGPAVADLARRPLAFDTEPYPAEQAHGLGRFFHGLADKIEADAWRAEENALRYGLPISRDPGP